MPLYYQKPEKGFKTFFSAQTVPCISSALLKGEGKPKLCHFVKIYKDPV